MAKLRNSARETIARTSKVIGYRLGLYDPDPGRKTIRWVGSAVKPTRENATDLREAVMEFNRLSGPDSDVHLCAGVFPVRR